MGLGGHAVVAKPSTVAAIDPSTLSPLVGWDFSNSGSVTLASGNVSQVNDASGNSRHFTQGTAASRPLLVSAAQNGRDVARFDGSNDYLTGSNWPASTGAPITVIFAFKTDATINKNLISGSALYVYKQNAAGGKWSMYGSTELASSTNADTSAHVITAQFNGASSLLRLDGAQIASGDAGTAAITTAQPLTLGAALNGTQAAAVDHMEGWAFASALSLSNMQGVEAWLKSRWGTV